VRPNEEPRVGYLPNITAPEMADSPSGRHYRALMELSASARGRGEHREAQQFATAAHKWAMAENVRFQKLLRAQDALASATHHLQTAWDKHRTCATLDELCERHPECKRMVLAWERARDAVRELRQPQPGDGLDGA
jgi:hypothetical protein